MKKLILRIIKQIIYRMSEHTPAHVKYSERNHKIGSVVLTIDELIKLI